jgi:hypothetical protein
MSFRRHRSHLLEATLPLSHSLKRERTGMITDLWQKRNSLLCPPIWGIGLRRERGPQALLYLSLRQTTSLEEGTNIEVNLTWFLTGFSIELKAPVQR